ncbi:MAG TPA: glycosyl transferase [Pseudolabrys sp.]|jgi:UDP-N-acetylmuramyl pentapeptide phosphotransferase/UDP-N-acetylglucosamine-1-phosphate transferase
MIAPLSIWPFAEEFIVIVAAAAILCALFIVVLRPLLVRYALARPNARSSHREPTPQGGGIAVVAAMTLVLAGIAILTPQMFGDPQLIAIVFGAVIGLAVVGATDDIRPMEALPRLALQAVAALVVLAVLPAELQIFPFLPWWLERALMLIGILWFVNLVNFMDGLDWIMVAEIVPVTAALVAIGALGALPSDGMVVSLALLGAILGFAPFNRPVAKLFLGDVGSLPIGLLLAWLLILLAGNGFIIAAILLPLYYIADATITLFRRLLNGEQITQAHRSHFYQRATDGGFGVYEIVMRVFAANVVLALLAISTVLTASRELHLGALAAGCLLVAVLLWRFERGKR